MVAFGELVAQTVKGLGYDLVDVQRSVGGLLRVTIDFPWLPSSQVLSVTVEDCEKVTRQLQYVLEVEGVNYKRLEVSSPGIDRPLRHQQDFERFTGQVVDITLKLPLQFPLGSVTNGQANGRRKKFRGVLECLDNVGAEIGTEPHWQIVWRDELPMKPGQKPGKKRQLPPLQALDFVLSDLKDARLAPMVSFKEHASILNDASQIP
jgi:ribosome maturation factor RimP